MDDLKVDLSLDACPSPRNLSGRRLHRCPGARQPGGASRLLLLLSSALQGRPCVRGCGLRTSTRRLARERKHWPETVVRGDGGPRRDVVRRQRSRRPVVPQRPPDRAQAIAQVAPPLRLDRGGAVLRLPLPGPNVVEPDAAGGGAAGSSRRPLRRDFPGLQAGGDADPLRETILRARGEPRSGSLFADRTSTMRANQLRLDFATFASHGGEGRSGRRRGGQGACRFGRNFSRSPSAFRFGGFRSRFRRSGPGRICSPGSWRTCGCRRPQPDVARGPRQPFSRTAGHGTGMFGCSAAS